MSIHLNNYYIKKTAENKHVLCYTINSTYSKEIEVLPDDMDKAQRQAIEIIGIDTTGITIELPVKEEN